MGVVNWLMHRNMKSEAETPVRPRPENSSADAKTEAEQRLINLLGIATDNREMGRMEAAAEAIGKLAALRTKLLAQKSESLKSAQVKANERLAALRDRLKDKKVEAVQEAKDAPNIPPAIQPNVMSQGSPAPLPLLTTSKVINKPSRKENSTGIFSFFSYRGLAKAYSNDLSGLIARVDALRLTDMKDQLPQMKAQGRRSLGVLQLPRGTPLNICPRCGSSLRAARGGTKISCTNQRCFFVHDLPLKHLNISELRLA